MFAVIRTAHLFLIYKELNMKKLNGIKLNHRKNTENSATVELPVPALVRIPMSMHMGAPCTPLVKVGDAV